MKPDETVEHNALNWVKKELDAVLNQIRVELEAYLEDPSEQDRLVETRSLLAQVQGTLQMVELYGAAMLAEEMEEVAQAIMIGEARNKDEAFEVLMRALLQLPDYLEHIQMGHRDIPIILLPLLNDLRATRDASLLSENVLFFPDIETTEEASAEGRSVSGEDPAQLAKKLRHTFQLGLLGWFRNKDVAASLTKLSEVLARLRDATSDPAARRLWWTGGALAEALSLEGLESSVTVKQLMGKIDRQIKQLIDKGEAQMAALVPAELSKNILYYVARAPSQGEQVTAVKTAFKLSELLPEGGALEAAKESLAGPNLELLNTVSQAIREDLTEVKDTLEIFVHADNRQVGELEPVAEKLNKIADTLGMLGLGEERKRVVGEARKIGAMVEGTQEASEAALLDVAGAMLGVESAINDFISGRANVRAISRDSGDTDQILPESEYQNVLSAVIRETLMDMNKAKEAILEFIDSPQNAEPLGQTPELIERIKGAMFMLPLERVMPLLDSIKQYVAERVLGQRATPSGKELESLADAITSVEFYLEALAENRGDHQNILNVGYTSVARLGYPVAGEAGAELGAGEPERPASLDELETVELERESGAPAQAQLEETGEEFSLDVSNLETLELETPDLAFEGEEAGETLELESALGDDDLTLEIEAPTSVPEAAPEPPVEEKPRPEPLVGEIDDEILEIFLEEAEEEIERINKYLPLWQENVTNEEALTTVRRSFHTLKGSGRLVGAQLIGEFAWAFESLLNKVIEKTIEPALHIFEALNKASKALPQLVVQLKGEGEPQMDVFALMDEAEAMGKADYAQQMRGGKDDESEADKHAFIGEEVDDSSGEFEGVPEPEGPAAGPEAPAVAGEATHEDAEDVANPGLADEPQFSQTDTETLEIPLDSGAPDAEAIDFDLGSEDWGEGGEELESDTIELELPEFAEDLSEPEPAESEEATSAESALAERLGIDPTLFEIYKGEALQHLDTLDAACVEAQGAKGQVEVTDEVLRALHTLNGSSRTANVPEIYSKFGPLERYAKAHEGLQNSLPADALGVLEDSVRYSRDVLRSLSENLPEVAGGDALQARLDALLNEDLAIRPTVEVPAPPVDEALEAADIEAISLDSEALDLDLSGETQELPTFDVSDFETPVPEEPGLEEPVFDESILGESALDEPAPEESEPQEPVFEEPVLEESAAEQAEPGLEVFARKDEEPQELVVELTEPADAPDMPGEQDLELVEIFLEEAVEIMDASDNALQTWEGGENDEEAVTELQRQLHTLKGGARMAGFTNIGNLSHSVESLIIAVVEQQAPQASAGMFNALHRTFDRLSVMLEQAKKAEPVAAAPELIAELDALRSGQAPVVPAPTAATPEEPPEAQAVQTPAEEQAPAPVEEVLPDNVVELQGAPAQAEPEAAEEPRAPARAAQQELIRVRSELLDNLVNHAGEVNIYHARLEEQITGFGFNLSELNQTVSRLREQLRKLELETETQIRSSYAHKHAGEEGFKADFDPLEMDQYSTIQQLSRSLAESLNDLLSIQDILTEQVRDTETLLLQQSRVSTDLQEGLMRTRMAQFTGTVPRLRRIVRQTAAELDKKVDLQIEGENSELDRSVLERMVAPFEHMLRNAIAHGIEAPAERLASGKPENGTISIKIGREGSEVVIEVSDDGGGININAIRAKAEKVGLIGENDSLSDHDVMQLILESGFSTAQEVSQIAGRGVGMDVVNNEIKQLGGVLRIDSSQGKGTIFTVRLPFTLAINQALLVQSGDDLFAISLASIEGIVRYTAGELKEKYLQEHPMIEYAAFDYELKHLGALLGMSQPYLEDPAALYPMLLVRSGEHRMALHVEALMGSREIVVKPVGPQMSKARGVAGATILGDGRVVLILDIPALVRIGAGVQLIYEAPKEEVEEERPLTVMVVDDSITIRKVTARMLERNNFAVTTAKDGVEAVSQLQDSVPDLMLLDIEMPRMDGYELAQHMRNDQRLKDVPIIMITSRTGEKHRKRALDIGVNRYLGKPYQESDLLENITALLEAEGRIQGLNRH